MSHQRPGKLSEWIESQLRLVRSLVGSTVSGWECIEMALNEPEDESDLIWNLPTIPMLQCTVLFLCVNDSWQQVFTYHDDNEWGLYLSPSENQPKNSNGMSPIFRFRSLSELPVGLIVDASAKTNERGNISSIDLRVGEKTINLLAGEVYEGPDGSFEVFFMDESVLVQVGGGLPGVG